jgi:AraC-like DNA-binding protein
MTTPCPSTTFDHPAPEAAGLFAGVDFSRGRLFETCDLEEARQRSGEVFAPHQLHLLEKGAGLRARLDHLPLGPLSLNRLTWQARVAVDPGNLPHCYLLTVPLRGHSECRHGRGRFVAHARQPCLVGGGERFHFSTTADFEQVVLHIPRAALESAWQTWHGEPPRTAIVFHAGLPAEGEAWRVLQPWLQVLARDLQAPGPAAPGRQMRASELLLNTLLLLQPHSLQDDACGTPVRRPTAGSTPLRRAMEHMRQHLGEPLTLGDVAQAAGVPARTLQSAFQRSQGQGPMQWLRQQRLQAVRAALLASGGEPTVTAAALRFGFAHLGEFGQHYRRAFGESPRETLARRR